MFLKEKEVAELQRMESALVATDINANSPTYINSDAQYSKAAPL